MYSNKDKADNWEFAYNRVFARRAKVYKSDFDFEHFLFEDFVLQQFVCEYFVLVYFEFDFSATFFEFPIGFIVLASYRSCKCRLICRFGFKNRTIY